MADIIAVENEIEEEGRWYPENTLIEGEAGSWQLERVAVTFAFISQGQIVVLDPQMIKTRNYNGIELFAAVASGEGPEGLFARAVWFGEGGTPWKWMRIQNIVDVYASRFHYRFRGVDDPVVRVVTLEGEYTMTIPHPDYQDAWRRTLANLGPIGLEIDVKILPLGGYRPLWWDDCYKDYWPFDKSNPPHERGLLPVTPAYQAPRLREGRDRRSTASVQH